MSEAKKKILIRTMAILCAAIFIIPTILSVIMYLK